MSILESYPSLSQIPLLAVASPSHLESLLNSDAASRCTFEPGEVIYSSESSAVYVGILLSGRAEIHTAAGDERTLLKILFPQDMFGIANLYATDMAFPSVIRASDVCEVLFLEGSRFRDFLENDPATLRFYLQFLSKKIVYLNQKIATFSAGSVEKRLALFLCESKNNDGYLGSMTTLSELLGIGRASLYRAIDKLCSAGLIRHEGNRLIVSNAPALLSYCQNS